MVRVEQRVLQKNGKIGRMTDAGRAVLPDMSEKEFAIDDDILKAITKYGRISLNFILSGSVETVCLLSKQKPDNYG